MATIVSLTDNYFGRTVLTHLAGHQISFKLVRSRLNTKNLFDSKYGFNRSIFQRLHFASPDQGLELDSIEALQIFNHLHGSHLLSDFELHKGLTGPMSDCNLLFHRFYMKLF